MSRRPNSANAGVSLFPFLAVLLCTMGSLVLLLMLIASQTKAQAEAEKALAAKPKIDTEAIRRREEDLQWKIDQLAKSREKTLADVAEHRAQLSHFEEHASRLKRQLADLEAAEALLKSQAAGDQAGRGALAADLEELRRKIAEAEKKLAAEKSAGRKPQAFAVVPYDGDKGTRRRPIYIECRGDSIILQPEGIKFVESDFAGSLGPSNPLATAVRLTSEYLTRGESYREGEQPYPLLLVRPSGIGSYYAARAGMSSWEGEFGYELIDEDWPLEFPPPDPLLSQMIVKAVEEARVRQVMLARAAPSIRNKGPKATFRVSPSGGGIVQEGGSGNYGGSRGSRYSADRSAGGSAPRGSFPQPTAGGGYSSTRQPTDKFASVNNGAAGGNVGPSGSGTSPGLGGDAARYPGSAGNGQPGSALPGTQPGLGGAPGGDMVAATPTINGPGGSGLGGPGVGGSGGLSDDRYGTGAAGTTGGTLGDRYGGVPGSSNGLAAGGTPDQPSSTSGPSLGAPTGTGGTAGVNGAAGGFASNGANSYVGSGSSGNGMSSNDVAVQNGSAGGYSSTRNTGDTQQASNGQGGGTNTGPAGAAGMNGGTSNTSSGVAGTGYGSSEAGSSGGGSTSSGGQSAGSSVAGTGGGSAGQVGQPGGAGGASGDPTGAPNISMNQNVPPPGPGEYVEPMSGKRGKNWGLPEESRRSTAITRPIQIYCTGNNLTVLNDKGIPDKQIVMEGPTVDSVDTLVSTVWDQVTTWGIAGRGMYWKPKLVVHVSPDGAQRFNDLKQLLDGSGLEVSGKQIAVAQPVSGGRR
jgi:hypothetical protein